MKVFDVLIVDDHPTIIEAYKSILNASCDNNVELNYTIAYNCKEAYQKIQQNFFKCDVALLDLKLPAHESEKIYSGEDLALLIKKTKENCKIIILTSSHETFILYELINRINPQGILVKSDFVPEELGLAFNHILKGETYYSQTVKMCFKTLKEQELHLDSTNRQLISLLAKGVQTKNLPKYLNISLSSVDKRKSHIKLFLGIDKGSDEDIVLEAKLRGFI